MGTHLSTDVMTERNERVDLFVMEDFVLFMRRRFKVLIMIKCDLLFKN